MKKSKTFFACAMLAALASCSNDHVLSQQSPTPSDPDVINIVAASSKPVTRAVEDATNLQNTQFVAEEKINVYLEEVKLESETAVITYTPKVYKVTTNEGEVSGSLVLKPADDILPKFPSNEHGVLAYAFYPSTVSKTTGDNTTFTVELDQSKDENYKKSDLMFGTNNYNTTVDENYGKPIASFEGTKKGNQVPLYFKHQLAKVIVKMDETSFSSGFLTGATIKLKGVKNEFTYKASKNGVEHISLTGDATVEVKLGTYNADGNACIIAPQDVAAETEFIEITTNGSPAKTYVYKIPTGSSKTFESGKKYIYNIKLSGGSLVVISTKIEEWGTGETVDGTADLKTES